jgi:DNA-binding transcriptional MerR regulator
MATEWPDGGLGGLFPIRVVAQLTGINPVTIRAWERRYGLVRPARTPGGHRLYSQVDVERLRAAARLVARGVSISGAARMLLESGEVAGEQRDNGLAHWLERFAERLEALDDRGMHAVVDAAEAQHPGLGTALVDRLPGLARGLPHMQAAFLDAWLEGRLTVAGSRSPGGEPRVLLAAGAEPRGHRTWALALASGLHAHGLRPVVVTTHANDELAAATGATSCTALVLAGTAVPPQASLPSGLPVFCRSDEAGGTGLGDDLAAARSVLASSLRAGAAA